jgi:hypothetical protein
MVDMSVVNIEAAHDGERSKVGEGGRDAGRSNHPRSLGFRVSRFDHAVKVDGHRYRERHSSRAITTAGVSEIQTSHSEKVLGWVERSTTIFRHWRSSRKRPRMISYFFCHMPTCFGPLVQKGLDRFAISHDVQMGPNERRMAFSVKQYISTIKI